MPTVVQLVHSGNLAGLLHEQQTGDMSRRGKGQEGPLLWGYTYDLHPDAPGESNLDNDLGREAGHLQMDATAEGPHEEDTTMCLDRQCL